MKWLLAVTLLVFSLPAVGCFVPPPEQSTAPDALIARTKNIVLARVVGARAAQNSYNVLYTLKNVRTLKGQAAGQFQVTGYPAILEDENLSFNDHTDGQFWSNHVGRSPNDTDCEIHPTFSVGRMYLVFLDRPYHVKSFELITHAQGAKRDKWLRYVESRTGP